MKIALCADVHTANHRRYGGPLVSGINTRCRQVLNALTFAVQTAKERECDAFVVLGDLFDTEKPSPQIIAEVQRILSEFPCTIIGPNVYILPGNHDMASSATGDHALGPLSPVAHIVEKPELHVFKDAALALVPYGPGKAVEHISNSLEQLLAKRRPKVPILLGFHAGVQDGDTPIYLQGSESSIHIETLGELMLEHRIKYATCGDYHERLSKFWPEKTESGVAISRFVNQIGTLCPTGFDNATDESDLYGWMSIWDSDQGFKPIRVPGPRFYVKKGLEGIESFPLKTKPNYLLLKVPPEHADAAREVIETYKAGELILDGDVEIDRSLQRDLAQKTASVIREKETLSEALSEFVKTFPFEGEIDRDAVLNRARGYLKV